MLSASCGNGSGRGKGRGELDSRLRSFVMATGDILAGNMYYDIFEEIGIVVGIVLRLTVLAAVACIVEVG